VSRRTAKSNIPVIADFLKAAAEHSASFRTGRSAKSPSARLCQAASAAGLTRDQIVRIYAFETAAMAPTMRRRIDAAKTGSAGDISRPRIQSALEHQQRRLLAEHGEAFIDARGKRLRT